MLAKAELEQISSVRKQLMTPQNSKPNVTNVQDTLLAWYLATHGWIRIPEYEFQQLVIVMDNFNIGDYWKKLHHIKKIYEQHNLLQKHGLYHGKTLFSFLLPNDLQLTMKTGGSDIEPTLKIVDGVLIEGCATKKVVGGSTEGLIAHIYKEYGEDRCCDFINNANFLGIRYLSHRQFTVGIGDCLTTRQQEIEDAVNKAMLKCSLAEEETDPVLKEIKISGALNEARDAGNKVAKNALARGNNIRHMVVSGTKGDYNNILQITSILGQQNYEGQRLPLLLRHGTKALPHYRPDERIDEPEERYESRGFVKNNLLDGLNPREFWAHHVVGRKGIADTACKTSETGYLQRKMGKNWEDYKVHYDGTVRSANGSIIQFIYGDDGMDGAKLCHVPKIGVFPVNIKRLIGKLNARWKGSEQIPPIKLVEEED